MVYNCYSNRIKKYVPDGPGHGTIQPIESLPIEENIKALFETAGKWGVQQVKKQDFCKALINGLQCYSGDILKLRKLLVEYMELGITQTEMLECLSELRNKADDRQEDIILDLMDFVTGFCNPTFKIFED